MASTQALYRKYRSRTFSELVGQEHVVRTLRNAARTGRVAHAYLFSGPRGVGKTSAARLLAKAVNCTESVDGEPCGHCASCVAIAEGRAIDVVEIDAASNRGIDEIRNLRERVGFAPADSRYKFYILDEAHMLTGEAANAFLKTLEEPPAHAVFVLVTTEAHRVPATVLSRCQRLEFRRLSMRAIIARLEHVCSEEGIETERAALELIARSATGSMRDAEALLDQLVSYSGRNLTVEQLRAIAGYAGSDVAQRLLVAVVERDAATGLRLINQCVDEGADPRQLARDVVDFLRAVLLVKAGPDLASMLDLTDEAVEDVKRVAARVSAADALAFTRLFLLTDGQGRSLGPPQLPLELALLECIARQEVAGVAAPTPPVVEAPSPLPARRLPPVAAEPAPAASEPAAAPSRTRPPAEPAAATFAGTIRDITQRWSEVVDRFGVANRSVQALLRDARPISCEQSTLTLGCKYPFHRDRLSEDRTRGAIEGMLRQVFGGNWVLRCVVDTGSAPTPTPESPPDRISAVLDDPVVKGAITLGWRVKKITHNEEVVYDAESQDDPAAPGSPRQDPGGAR